MLIHLLRHTTPDVEKGTCYGQTDLQLAASFTQEAALVQRKLNKHYSAVYSSPLQRCFRLSEMINKESVKTDPRLMELNFGAWEGKAWRSIPRNESQQWTDDFVNLSPPEGESLLVMQARVTEFIQQELIPHQYDSVLIVTHAGVIRLFVAWALNIPLDRVFNLKLDYGALVNMEYNHDSETVIVHFI